MPAYNSTTKFPNSKSNSTTKSQQNFNSKSTTKPKKLTLANLKSDNAKLYPQRKVIINNYEFTIDEKFRPSKMSDLLAELAQQQKYAEENGFLFDPLQMLYILTIKHFTSIEIPDSYDEQILCLTELVDRKYFGLIMNEFNTNEFNEIMNLLQESVRTQSAIIQGTHDAFKQVNEDVENLEKELTLKEELMQNA